MSKNDVFSGLRKYDVGGHNRILWTFTHEGMTKQWGDNTLHE